MSVSNEYSHQLNLIKAVELVTAIQKRQDQKAWSFLKRYKKSLVWEPLSKLMIEDEVWKYVVNVLKSPPQLVFCHPDILIENGSTSLYYRNSCGLSLKGAKTYFGAVETIEAGGRTMSGEKALKMARTFNTFTCSIIRSTTAWTLENGYRTTLATMGITLDGKMRNRIGTIGEDKIRRLILAWLLDSKLIISPKLTKEQLKTRETLPKEYALTSNMIMRFAAEPDITFLKNDEILAVIEIKGGVDAAGALERYGAAKKSFEHSVAHSNRCKNFYLAAVLTPELENRIKKDRLVEKWFHIVRLLESGEETKRFFDELFHHTLRLI